MTLAFVVIRVSVTTVWSVNYDMPSSHSDQQLAQEIHQTSLVKPRFSSGTAMAEGQVSPVETHRRNQTNKPHYKGEEYDEKSALPISMMPFVVRLSSCSERASSIARVAYLFATQCLAGVVKDTAQLEQDFDVLWLVIGRQR